MPEFAAGSPTVRRRELGFVLRSLRKNTGLTTEQAAKRLGFSRSKISRLETGQRGAKPGDIRRMCDLYRADEALFLRMTDLATEGKERAWWQPLGLPHRDYVGLEAEATSICDYGLALVPGLLQTPDYAGAVVRAGMPRGTPRVIAERVDARMARQRRLTSETPPDFEAVLDESVLHRIVGSPALMADQLRRLVEMAQLPNVSIRIVPYDAGAVPNGVSKFVILRLTAPDITSVVHLEDLTNHRILDRAEEVETYITTFQALTGLSADRSTSLDMILAKIAYYESATG